MAEPTITISPDELPESVRLKLSEWAKKKPLVAVIKIDDDGDPYLAFFEDGE